MHRVSLRALLLSLTLSAPALFAQSANNAIAAATPVVPRLVNFSGKVIDAKGSPIAGVATVSFAIYKDEDGGSPLWLETQNVQADESGSYTVQLGATEPAGLALDLFNSGESRWLGVAVNGGAERPRILLLSVPYALKAADAETLGGLPASAFVRAGTTQPSGKRPDAVSTPGSKPRGQGTNPSVTGAGLTGYVPLWDSTSDIVSSNIFQQATSVGIGTALPAATLDVNGKADLRDTLTLVPKLTDPVLAVSGSTFAVGSTGKVTFAVGQTFPGTGAITGITTGSTSGLQGGGTSGVLSLSVKTAGISNSMLAHPSVSVPVTAPLTGGGSVALGGATVPLAIAPCASGNVLVSNGTTWSCTAAAGTGKVASVALSAPATDFVVSGSPITTAGTLALKWNTPPSATNVANSIVKRDATGSFAATSVSTSGAIISNGGGVSGASSTGGYGVSGTSSGVGVQGQSTGTASGANGVQGNTTAVNGSGVAGFNNAGGIGIYGQGGTGVAGVGSGAGGTGVVGVGDIGFSTNNNVQQGRTAGGWVKAMVYVNQFQAPYSIVRCFNSTLVGAAATTVPCGIDLEEVSYGHFHLNFNFEVDDRFYVATLGNSFATSTLVWPSGKNQLTVDTLDASVQNIGGTYSLIIF